VHLTGLYRFSAEKQGIFNAVVFRASVKYVAKSNISILRDFLGALLLANKARLRHTLMNSIDS